jgi:exonuclease III
VRFVSWNILAGGGSRCRKIVRRLRHYDADVLVLQETVAHRAADVCHALKSAGYTYGFSAPRGPRERGLCLLSRIPMRRVAEPAPPHAGIYPRGWIEVELERSGMRVAAVYGPAAGPALPTYWAAAADWLACRTTQPFIMLGDFNMGASLVDAPDYRFKAGRSFARLAELGLVDLWRRERKNRREYTWFSRPGGGRTPRGFRIDHAFASPALADRLVACRYDHGVRQRGWSDHSLLVVDLSASA